MADASSIRNATTLPAATLRNQGSIRWNRTGVRPVISDGTHWRISGLDQVTYTMNANASLADQNFFVAPQACKVLAISEVHAVAGNDAGAVNVQVEKVTGTTAPGAGINLLTNNTNAGFNLKGTANTVQVGALSATASDLVLAAGDRLAVDFAGTLTTLAGVTVTVLVAYIE